MNRRHFFKSAAMAIAVLVTPKLIKPARRVTFKVKMFTYRGWYDPYRRYESGDLVRTLDAVYLRVTDYWKPIVVKGPVEAFKA